MENPCDASVVFYLKDGQISGLFYKSSHGPRWEQADLIHVARQGSEDPEPAVVLGVGG